MKSQEVHNAFSSKTRKYTTIFIYGNIFIQQAFHIDVLLLQIPTVSLS